ncbi:amino acid adenylation domain-containing protein [Pseudomonas sp. NPDC089734]|uniref:amino acid adenylation domain-containing protein n=1 Tax=Pseudomonas sp. NPDC089734 TaxID=3364469 RepID=UPI0037F369E1
MDFVNPADDSLLDAQAGIWYASQAAQSSALYMTAQALRLHGDLDMERLHRAISCALVDCEVLSIRYISVQGRPVLEKRSQAPLLEVCDLRGKPDPGQAAQAMIAESLKSTGDLGSNELHGHCLYHVSDHEVIWLSRIHHIAFDSYAYHLLHRRAAEHYHALMNATPVKSCTYLHLDALRAEDSAYRSSMQYILDRHFWLERGKRFVAPTFSGAAPYELSGMRIQAQCHIPRSLAVALKNFHQRSRIPLADALIALFGSYFSRFNNRQQMLFGLPLMGRLDASSAQAAITRSNILPLDFELPGVASFIDACTVVGKSRKDVIAHQRYRSEWISRELGRIGDALPLYGIELNILPCLPLPGFTGLSSSLEHVATGPVRDLNLHVEVGSDLQIHTVKLIANGERHTLTDLNLHLERMQHWLGQLLAAPAVPMAHLPFACARERDLIETWNATDHLLASDNILDLFEKQASTHPQRIAVLDESRHLTYRELDEQTQGVAHGLQKALGDARGKVVAVMLDRSVELQVAMLAVLRAGAVLLPLSSQTPMKRLSHMLEQAQASLVIASTRDHDNVPGHILRLPIEQLHNAIQEPLPRITGTEAAYILFTSGSSGEPKGVQVNHLALANRLQWMQAQYGLEGHDRVLQKTPVTFDVSIWEFFWPMISGATLVMAREQGHTDPDYLLDCIERHGITTLHFVPSMLALFVDAQERRQGSSNLSRVFASGEALPRELAERFRRLLKASLFNLYGPTEAAIDVTHHPVDEQHTERTVPIGRPIWNTRIHILGEEAEAMPVGAIGELFIEGICLADGYIGQPALTAEKFIDNAGQRLYRTGDLARWCANGEIEFLGRIDHQVKIRGVRIELDEIASVLLRHENIASACAAVHGDRLVAYAVASGQCSETMLREHAREYLPDYMVPQRIVLLDELPTTGNGKLDRGRLPLPSDDRIEQGVPVGLVEQRICEYFTDVLERPGIGPEHNFFELGGHSLTAVDMAARINAGLGWKISIATLFAHPTPRALAAHGDGGELDMLASALLLRPAPNEQAGLPTLFCIHPAGGISWCYSGIARFLKTPCRIVGIQADGLAPGSSIATSMDAMARDYVDRICAYQPDGPYWIIGWSVGGMIAHDVAARLERQGRHVELLALMDAYPSDLWRRFAFTEQSPREEESMALAALLFIAGIPLPFDRGLPSLTIPRGEFLERAQVIAMLRCQGNALASLDDATLDRLIDVVINSRRLVGGSQHNVFNGNMLFFTAARPRAEDWLTLEAWRPYVNGRITNLNIDSDHPGMARTEALKAIAGHLDSILGKTRPAADKATTPQPGTLVEG